MNKEVTRAARAVMDVFPEVKSVYYSSEGAWCYMGSNAKPLSFMEDNIDLDLLQEAVDSLDDLPKVFEFTKKNFEYKVSGCIAICPSFDYGTIEALNEEDAKVMVVRLVNSYINITNQLLSEAGKDFDFEVYLSPEDVMIGNMIL